MKEYRTKQINFRVTESEYARISERMQEAGVNHPSAYLRKMAMDGYILKLDLGDLQEIQRLARGSMDTILRKPRLTAEQEYCRCQRM